MVDQTRPALLHAIALAIATIGLVIEVVVLVPTSVRVVGTPAIVVGAAVVALLLAVCISNDRLQRTFVARTVDAAASRSEDDQPWNMLGAASLWSGFVLSLGPWLLALNAILLGLALLIPPGVAATVPSRGVGIAALLVAAMGLWQAVQPWRWERRVPATVAAAPSTGPSLHVDSLPEWLRLNVTDPDNVANEVAERFVDRADTPERLAEVAVGLGDLAAQLRDLDVPDQEMLMAWVLLPPGGVTLVPQAVATLSAVRVSQGTDAAAYAAEIAAANGIKHPIGLERISTGSGPAFRVRFRHGRFADRNAVETVSVFWVYPTKGMVLHLGTLPIDDPAVADHASRALVDLAASFWGP